MLNKSFCHVIIQVQVSNTKLICFHFDNFVILERKGNKVLLTACIILLGHSTKFPDESAQAEVAYLPPNSEICLFIIRLFIDQLKCNSEN